MSFCPEPELGPKPFAIAVLMAKGSEVGGGE